MKRFFVYITIGIIVLLITLFLILNKEEKKETKDLKTIKVAEVTHSIFYAPFYVAIENGYFEKNNINIDLILVSGSDNVAASVLSSDTQVGLAGPESAIYVYTGGEKDYLQVFCGLTKRDGQFIVSKNKDFKWQDLIGKEILVGRSTGMPALSFFKALENEGIDKNKVKINTSIEFAELSGAFISGDGDFVNLFEPVATKLEKNNHGYVVKSVGLSSDAFPYTAFYARKSFIKNNKELLDNFTKAIDEGIKYVNNTNSEKIAKVLHKQFSDSNIKDLSIQIERYKNADVWLDNPYLDKELYNNLISLLEENNLLKKTVYYDKLINNMYEK